MGKVDVGNGVDNVDHGGVLAGALVEGRNKGEQIVYGLGEPGVVGVPITRHEEIVLETVISERARVRFDSWRNGHSHGPIAAGSENGILLIVQFGLRSAGALSWCP